MLTPAERAKAKHEHRHGRRHHEDPAKVEKQRRAAALRASGWRGPVYGQGAYQGVLGQVMSTGTNPPVSGPAPDSGVTAHLNPDQFVGYSGGFSTDAGNYTGVQAIEGAAGNGGAGGIGDSGGAPA